jgi:spermidine synthase
MGRHDEPLQELGHARTPIGEVSLRLRRDPKVPGVDLYEIKLGDEFLMSSLFHAAEDALAVLGLAPFRGATTDVVVGGLGLGYTAASALAQHGVRTVVVVDYLEAVIDWHRRGLVPMAATLTADPRCRFVQGDFFALAQEEGAAFDTAEHDRRYHAVLLDIDHSPRHLLSPRNTAFYSVEGLRRLARHLHADGVFALWADGAPDPAWVATLEASFVTVETHVVAFPNPYLDHESSSTVYVARTPRAASP